MSKTDRNQSMELPETPIEPSVGSEIANKPELTQLNDGILRQAWQNVLEAEKSGKQTSETIKEDPKDRIDDEALSPKVEYVREKYKGLEGDMLRSIHKNRHRVRELVQQLQEKTGTGNHAVSYDKLFDYLTKELWFTHFARNVKLKSGEAFTESLNYRNTVEQWVDQLMDQFLFQEIKIEDESRMFSGYVFGYYLKNVTSNRNLAKNYLEGQHIAEKGGQELHFENLWEYLYNVIANRSRNFFAVGTKKNLYLNSERSKDLRSEQENEESARKLKECLEKAPVDIFRHCYFEKAKHLLPKDKTVDLDSEEQIEKFINWVSNNFVHSLPQGLTKFETPEQQEEPEPSEFTELMPDFSELDGVSAEMKILYIKHMFRRWIFRALVIQEKSSVAAFGLEVQFWDSIKYGGNSHDRPIVEGKIKNDADVYLRKKWHHLFRSRKKIAAKYDRLQANPDVEQLVTFMKYLFSLYTVAKVYEKSTDPEQQRQAKFYLELVRLYGKQLQQTVVNLEARLKVPQFKPDDLTTAIYTVQSLMNRTVHAEQMQALSEVETDVKLLGEATGELNGTGEEELADFDRKLEGTK